MYVEFPQNDEQLDLPATRPKFRVYRKSIVILFGVALIACGALSYGIRENDEAQQVSAPVGWSLNSNNDINCDNECGSDLIFPMDKSIGGAIKKSPYLLYLKIIKPGCGENLGCSAFFVSKNYVLTAKHCVYISYKLIKHCDPFPEFKGRFDAYSELPMPLDEIFLYSNVENINHLSNATRHIVTKIFLTKIYLKYHEDMALLKLAEPVKFDQNRKPLCLTENFEAKEGINARSQGFGRTTDPTLNGSINFRERSVGIISESACSSRSIPHNFICPGRFSHETEAGDSGGPLIIDNANRAYAVGVDSRRFGHGDNLNTWSDDRRIYPAHYLKISPFCNWLKTKTNGEVECAAKMNEKKQSCVDKPAQENLRKFKKNQAIKQDYSLLPFQSDDTKTETVCSLLGSSECLDHTNGSCWRRCSNATHNCFEPVELPGYIELFQEHVKRLNDLFDELFLLPSCEKCGEDQKSGSEEKCHKIDGKLSCYDACKKSINPIYIMAQKFIDVLEKLYAGYET